MLTVNKTQFNRINLPGNIAGRRPAVSFKGSGNLPPSNGSGVKAGAYLKETNILKGLKNLTNTFTDKVIGVTEKGLKVLAGTNMMKVMSEKINLKAFNRHIMPAIALTFSSCYIVNVLKSDKIEADRKKTLAANMGIVGALSTLTCYTLDHRVDNTVNKFIEKFGKANPDINYKNMKKGVKAAQGIIIFGLIYRLFSPTVATPMADKVSKAFWNKQKTKS